MLKKIYRELVKIRKELQAVQESVESGKNFIPKGKHEPREWRRFERLTVSGAERERLERVIEEHGLSRQDLAVILFGLRVRPEFGKKDFGI